MSHPLGMTTGRMLGAAALGAVYFGLLLSIVFAVQGAISEVNFYHSATIQHVLAGALPAMWIAPFAIPGGAVVAIAIGFPLGLIVRRFLSRSLTSRSLPGAAFLVGVIACAAVAAISAAVSMQANADAIGVIVPSYAESFFEFWWWMLLAGISSVLGVATVRRIASLRSTQPAIPPGE